jgi:hypothetical protein
LNFSALDNPLVVVELKPRERGEILEGQYKKAVIEEHGGEWVIVGRVG